MKNRYAPLALFLALVLCLFAFASCGKKKDGNGGATTAQTTAAPTETATTTEAFAHEHVPEDEYTVVPSTCTEAGFRFKYCAECGNMISETYEDLPIDPNNHVVENWIVTTQPTLLAPTGGARHGVCSSCGKEVEESFESVPTVVHYETGDSTNYYQRFYFTSDSRDTPILADGGHFYSTETEPDGNELLIEYSVLWNETLRNFPDSRLVSGLNERGSGINKDVLWLTFADNSPNSDCPWSGGFECGGGMNTVTFGGWKMDQANQGYADYPNIGGADRENPEWGWHRISLVFSQVLTNEDALKGDSVAGATPAEYKMTSTLYLDGVKVYTITYTGTGGRFGVNAVDGLFSAESDGQGGIVYTDPDDSRYVYGVHISNTSPSNGEVYFIYGDISVKIGHDGDFEQSVERVESPEAATYELPDGTTVPAPFYYKIK